jgi:cytochrome c-type biogenesis protein CcsB
MIDPVINPVLALYSDRLFMAAVGVYVLAMVLHAAEYALARTAGTAATRAPAAVGAVAATGAVVADEGVVRRDPSDGSAVRRDLSDDSAAARTEPDAHAGRTAAERFGGAAVNLVVLAAALQLGAVVTRGLGTGRWPLGNMYEFTSVFCLAAVVAWLVVLRRTPGLRVVGLFVLLPVVILLFLAGTVLYAQAAPVVPALRSYWLIVHVTTISTSSGLLVVPGIASLLYLLRTRGGGTESPTTGLLAARLPAAAALDRLAYRVTIVAFPLYTFGVIAGAVWAEAAWGRFWGWDPKETVAFVAWVLYAAYLHARATAGWRRSAPWINVAGLAVVLFNLFFINMVVAGLHSYAGLG